MVCLFVSNKLTCLRKGFKPDLNNCQRKYFNLQKNYKYNSDFFVMLLFYMYGEDRPADTMSKAKIFLEKYSPRAT